ncbi:hypothetical protein PAXINDRAFT_13020 [Paxillus involutus ATCC 200175]|uniref:Uncharacterized protein n=1 Tax=Paxillus involutus ATCC 200175 TaxID=664439 RepID=A0A0C9TV27_PAXIN|nr:hypothetical protein PAXINDRAFT_13020 [Paxillus involutus ATCC 200175]
MDINNVGSISQALYPKANPIYDHLEASKWQATQLSTPPGPGPNEHRPGLL